MPVMKKFAEKYDVRGFEGSPKLLTAFDMLLREFLGDIPETQTGDCDCGFERFADASGI